MGESVPVVDHGRIQMMIEAAFKRVTAPGHGVNLPTAIRAVWDAIPRDSRVSRKAIQRWIRANHRIVESAYGPVLAGFRLI
ncbi:hypothetical protein Pan44_35550 [Caulifigura coniformis]|uniref:Uncharacterized protein n=1 Tax=Caulifigura coniformis TaxID=2527983 RepID=A0A517SHA5_9PLAN|nr:hypothetical protein [Caulifigura coniformis]QDT55511.1 hypothetical protein Pan44_35550 [Caulifigura coniformis]